VYQNTNNTIQI